MRTTVLTLGLFALLVHASKDCRQIYVRVQYPLSPNTGIQQEYWDMNTQVGDQFNTYCITATAEFDPFSTCWYTGCTTREMICGFRLWRVRKSCDITTILNNNFNSQDSEWKVYDVQPAGDVHC
jgi:hypothetical protein